MRERLNDAPLLFHKWLLLSLLLVEEVPSAVFLTPLQGVYAHSRVAAVIVGAALEECVCRRGLHVLFSLLKLFVFTATAVEALITNMLFGDKGTLHSSFGVYKGRL